MRADRRIWITVGTRHGLVAGLILLLSGCHPSEQVRVKDRATVAVRDAMSLKVRLRTNVSENTRSKPNVYAVGTGLVFQVYDTAGTSYGGVELDVKDGIAIFEPEAYGIRSTDLVLISKRPGSKMVRQVLHVKPQMGGATYDFPVGYGDIDESGTVDLKDIAFIERWMDPAEALKDEIAYNSPDSADYNGNGKVDIDDLALAKSCLGMKDDPMPVWEKP